MTDRLQKLLSMLEKSPADPFLLYGIALEHKKSGNTSAAIEYLDKTIQADAGYCYAYYQRGQVLEMTGDTVAARKAYEDGIAAGQRKGDKHAVEELSTALAQLG